MTRTEIDAAMAAANPLTAQAAAALPLRGAELELAERIAAISVSPHPPHTTTHPPRRRRLVLLIAATAVVAVVVALLPSGQRDGGPARAFAAALVRFANASPLVLLQIPGWHVVYANEQPGGVGEMHFVRGPADADGTPQGASYRNQPSLAGRVASLTWGPTVRDQLNGHQTLATGLGVTVHRLIYEGGTRRAFDISALFVERGRGLEFRATVTDMAMFRAELRALHNVDATTWLRAMPPSVVKSADSGETIRQMLKGIPLPPEFDAARIRGARLVHDRYQLGAAVTGTIACMWIADWSHARATGDAAMVKRAITAMATAPHWPILREMAREGGWTQVLSSYAKAMPQGTIFGRSITADANNGLGCGYSWGIHLGGPQLKPQLIGSP